MKRNKITAFFLALFLIFTGTLCTGCSLVYSLPGLAFSGVKEKEIGTMDELVILVEDALEKGLEEVSFVTGDLSMEEVQEINRMMDGYYGTVASCESTESALTHRKKMSLSLEISDNYYVEGHLLEGKDIPEDREKAVELADTCTKIIKDMEEDLGKDASDYKKEVWIHDYLVLHTAYGFPEGVDEEQARPHESYDALVSHKAVCNGYAFGMKLLCDLCGIENRIVTGTGSGESHAWNLVKIGGDWYHVDVTWDDPSPDQEGRVVYTYLNINDERAGLGHVWNTGSWPSAGSMKENYYEKNGLFCEDYDAFKEKCVKILKKGSSDHFQLMVGDYDGSIYSGGNMDFLFDYTDYRSVKYQTIGEIPYTTLYLQFY